MLKKRLLTAMLAGSLTAGSLFCLKPPVVAYAAFGVPVTIMSQDNGTVTCNSDSAAEGSTVTVKVSPSNGYNSGGVAVADAENNAIRVTQVNAGEYSFVMPRTEVTVVPIFLAGGGGTGNDIPQDDTETSVPVSPESSVNTVTKPIVLSDSQSSVTPITPDSDVSGNNNHSTEDPATVDIANQTSKKVVTAGNGNSSTGTSAGASKNTETKTPVQSAETQDSQITESSEKSSSIIVSAENTNENDSEGNGNMPDAIDSGSVTVSSESASGSSGTLVVPQGGSDIVSNVAVIPSENGTAEADMLPVGTVVVPGSSAPQMALSNSGTQGAKQTKVVSSVTGENKVTSSVVGVTKVPDLLSTLTDPVLASSVTGRKTIEKNGVHAEKILSAYVPLILPIQTTEDGQIVTPENAKIISDVKSGNIRVASATVQFQEGWCPMDGSDPSDNDAENQISVSLRQNTTDERGKINLTKNN